MNSLQPEDLLKFRWLQGVAISPNGLSIAYTVRQPEAATNSYRTDLYLYTTTTRNTQKLAWQAGDMHPPVWSRDGSQVASAWQQNQCTHIEIWAADGSHQSTFSLEGSSLIELDWSPDGRRLAFSSWIVVQRSEDHQGPKRGIPAPTVRTVRRLRYKQDGAGWVHNRFRHIHVLDLDTGDLSQLTAGECDYRQPRWSWAGDRIACVAIAREQNTPLGQGQVMILDSSNGELTPLMPQWAGAAVSPQWRSDDSAIAFVGYQANPPVNRRLFYHVWLYDFMVEEARDLTVHVDQTIGNYAFSDQRAGLTNATVRWPMGEGLIHFLLTDQGAVHLYGVSESGETEKLVGGQRVIFEYSPASDGSVAFGMTEPDNPGDLYLLRPGQDDQPIQISNLNAWLNGHKLSKPQEYWYAGLDGKRVHAWEIRPTNFDERATYPTIVYVHCSMFSWGFSQEMQCLARAGFVVAYFNQRGTTAGYGQDHALGNYYGKHASEFQEIMLGVDDLADRPYIDGDRLGVTGGSCGGFMTNWIIGHTDRFAAAVTQRSVTDLLSKYGTSDNGPEQAESEGGGAPWQNTQHLWKSSPIAYATQINTPLLILHSEEDHRCALGQAEELFAALRWLGREVELVVFEGESHGLAHSGRPGNRIERMHRIRHWFEKYL